MSDKPITTNVEKLKSGKCLCMVCGKIQNPGWRVCHEGHRDDYIACYDNCEYENGVRAGTITWEGIQYGEPTPDGLSDKDMAYLAARFPDVLAEIERVWDAQDLKLKEAAE